MLIGLEETAGLMSEVNYCSLLDQMGERHVWGLGRGEEGREEKKGEKKSGKEEGKKAKVTRADETIEGKWK